MKARVPKILEIKYEIKFESQENFIMAKEQMVQQLCVRYIEGWLT